MRHVMVIDTLKCVGCSDCVVACQIENGVAFGDCRDWITESVVGTYPKVEMELRSERCNHCENPPCVRTCPTGSSHTVEGGTVVVSPNKCIGCGACIESCPYDARYRHPEGYVDKCTFCHHRVEKGMNPACVSVCPTRCMDFGDIHDPNSKVSKLLAERKHKVLAPEAGTKPKVYYLI